MRILKIKVPSEILSKLNNLPYVKLPDYFKVLNRITILQIFEITPKKIFALYRIQFKREMMKNVDKYLRNDFFAKRYMVVEKKSNEILCIMEQKPRNPWGFWPTFLSNSLALLPPIIYTPKSVVFGIITKDEELPITIPFLKQREIFKSIEILSTVTADDTAKNSMKILPRLTNRQNEIMNYATRKGYFQVPKRISTQEIADHFKITPSAILNHIQKAERSIMGYFFE